MFLSYLQEFFFIGDFQRLVGKFQKLQTRRQSDFSLRQLRLKEIKKNTEKWR